MTSEAAVVDADVVEEDAPVSSTNLAVSSPSTVVAPVQASDLVERMDKIREAMDRAMKVDVDYGKIPGTDKPTLLKPGAEKLAVMFRLDVQITHEERWGDDDHLTVPAFAMVYDQITGARLGRGEGLCSTRERKYAYRNQQRTCPTCNVEAIIKGKEEYGGGWLCFKKKGGCGAKFPDGSEVIESQVVGEVENPDLPDLWNTVIKMARKRALTDAVLLVTGASALFTQDVEADTTAVEAPVEVVPPFGQPSSDQQTQSLRKASAFLLSVTDEVPPTDGLVTDILSQIEGDAGGYLPDIVARAVCRLALAVRKLGSGASDD